MSTESVWSASQMSDGQMSRASRYGAVRLVKWSDPNRPEKPEVHDGAGERLLVVPVHAVLSFDGDPMSGMGGVGRGSISHPDSPRAAWSD